MSFVTTLRRSPPTPNLRSGAGGERHEETATSGAVWRTTAGSLDVNPYTEMEYQKIFSKMIQEGAFDKRLYYGIGHRRVWRHGVEQLRDATDHLVVEGKMTEKEQKDLLRELARRIADKFTR